MVGSRDGDAARAFIGDLTPRLDNRVQLTTNGHKVSLDAVEEFFAWDVDYAMLVKHYGDGAQSPDRKYSPVEFVAAEKRRINENPDNKHVSTSYWSANT